MEAGRELDALVAEKVMGKKTRRLSGNLYCWEYDGDYKNLHGLAQPIPAYSTDLSAAWEVVEKLCNWDVDDNMLVLQGQGPDLEKKRSPDGEAPQWWEAEIAGTWGKVMVEAETAPLAICLAALKAIAEIKKQEIKWR